MRTPAGAASTPNPLQGYCAPKESRRPPSRRGALRDFVLAVMTHAGRSGLTAAALVGGSALLDGAGLMLLAPLLGTITGGGEGWVQRWTGRAFEAVGVTDRLFKLWVLLGIFLALATLRAITGNRRDVALAALQTGFAQAERSRLIAALAGAPWPSLVKLRHSETNALLSAEVLRLASACGYLTQGMAQLVLLTVQIIVALLLAPALAVIALIVLAVGSFAFVSAQERIHRLGKGVVEANEAMMASAAALLGGLKSAIAQNAQHAFVAEFEATQATLKKHQLTFAQRQARGRMIYSVVSTVLAVGLLAIGAGVFAVPAAALFAVIVVFARMGPAAQQLYQSAQTLIFTVPAFEAIRRIEQSLQPPSKAPADAIVRPAFGPIALSHVTYVHEGGGGVRDVDLVVAPGEFLGVGGASGAGKTTLADLVVGLLEPQHGVISVGGEALEGPVRQGWRECVAYVTQDGFLFHDTVRRNLLWGAAFANESDIADAIAVVGADTMVGRLDRGLDTVIGERGVVLSGGERQRLVLARALLRRPRLLILDEAASGIDAGSELLLLGRLKTLDPRPSIVMISHREESLKHCDAVVRLEDGKVRLQP